MKIIKITDKTFSCLTGELSFREKTEIAKQLDKLGVDVIELPAVRNEKADMLLIKNIASVVENCAISIPTGCSKESVDTAYSCIKDAKSAIINVALPMSPPQMEYMCALKPDKMLLKLEELISYAKTLCDRVEFTALDATRAEGAFLYKAVSAAIKAGADTVTLCDDAAVYDDEEFAAFIKAIKENCEGVENVTLAVDVSNAISMSTACICAALKNGADAIKTSVIGNTYSNIEDVTAFLNVKGDKLGIESPVKKVTLKNICDKVRSIVDMDRSKESPYDGFAGNSEEIELHKSDDYAAVSLAVKKIGYELKPDDTSKVYEEFVKIAETREVIGTKELEAIIASVALQVPSTYRLVSYVINSGNVITATANLCIEKEGKELRGVYVGDGPIDAAFLAIEQVVGHHFELDDFQIQSVTEGREAMGQALVKLRSDSGKLYSGSGISTDVIGASIKAYLNALNKIAFEENR